VYELPIEADYAPNVYVSVFIVKGVDENNPVTAYRTGYVQLGVDTSQKVITLEVDSDVDSASPQQTVTYTVKATDYQGNPVQAELGVGVTDLAALSLLPMNSRTLMDFFYSKQGLGVETSTALSINTDQLTQQILETFKGGGGGAIGGGVVELRGEFIDTPFWSGSLTTDANGIATFDVRLPDNLTTWRADVRAVTNAPDGNMLVGQTTYDLQSTKPVLIRPVTPRFFIVGDEVSLGAVVNNNTDETQTVVVSLGIAGVTLKDNNPSQTIEIPAKGRGRVTWNVLVNDVDTIVATFTADAGQYTDATISGVSIDDNGSLPVYKYEVPETVGTAGVLFDADSLTESIVLPASEQGNVTVRVDHSLAGAALQTLDVFEERLYDCIECTISLMLPNIITYRALETANVADPVLKAELDYNVGLALQKIFAEQKADGGWGWYLSEPSSAIVTAYALIGLTEAKKQGFVVSDNTIIRAQDFLRTQFITPSLSVSRWQLDRQVFLLYALARSGAPDVGRTTALYEDNQRLSLYAQAWLAQSLFIINPNDKSRLDTLANVLINAAIPSASGVFWTESERDYYNWNTNTRTSAIVLQTLLQLRPDSQLLPNAVRHLMVQRQADFWETTQETAWVLMALTDWMVATNELNPSYSYTVNANGADVLADAPTRDTVLEAETLQIAVSDLLIDQANTFVFSRNEGEGAMYYTAFLNAYLPVPSVQEYENGIFVSRVYTRIGDPEQNPVTSGNVGDLIQVRLTIIAPNPLYYAVVTDYLPAGAEAVNPNLNTSQQIGTRPSLNPDDPLSRGWGWWYFSDIDFRDEKVVMSSTYLPAGTYQYVYTMRLSVAGTYNVIPTVAQEFYFPDVYGRSNGVAFTVLDGN
jgi:alpha-2-macroglobulin